LQGNTQFIGKQDFKVNTEASARLEGPAPQIATAMSMELNRPVKSNPTQNTPEIFSYSMLSLFEG